MSAPIKSRTFKSGNSVALRLPKALGVEAGTEMVIREERGRYIVEPVKTTRKKIDLSGIYGSIPGLKPIERLDMEPRELDREGKLLKRD
ncbi:AbrB/MazE/SpoVT family DNA-binding domain-containing protein [Rhizorhabdus wittichii]|uniref:AbrB/MazE/SpoVT family DNA-binding domain-containing protein n=1 Tax=Rhizorhabdus wittichii TaxID=160791 RepID=UPI0002E5A09C|nr:AbrB/MazE/SpoVT family DNA-binding domain-containing protein [Rhizorhabdus wittichii]